MATTWYERRHLMAAAKKKMISTDIVLDIGCGIQPQAFFTPLVHICAEPFPQYVEHLHKKIADKPRDRRFLILNMDWAKAVETFPENSVDTIFLVDVVEHLVKDESLRLLRLAEKIARRQIIIFTPLGFVEQKHPDGKDAWGLDGGTWQEHRSGWTPEDFDGTWETLACKDYHVEDNMGQHRHEAAGAFWAIKTKTVPAQQQSLRWWKIQMIRRLFDLGYTLGGPVRRAHVLAGAAWNKIFGKK